VTQEVIAQVPEEVLRQACVREGTFALVGQQQQLLQAELEAFALWETIAHLVGV
jgi:hypothetical protein